MTTNFDDIKVGRADLARGYLSLLRAQPGRPLALFGDRRIGKTFFLTEDLIPIAGRAGFVVVYADLWLYRTAPLPAISHALEEALDDLTVPESAVKRAGKTPVQKVGALGVSLDFGAEPQRRNLPDAHELRIDALVARICAVADKPLLLLLDEFQSIGESADGVNAIAALRAVLQKRKKTVYAVFTGSSQDGLAALVTAVGGPMYQFAQLLDFPTLGDDLLEALAARFARVHEGKTLDLAQLRAYFARLGHKPALMKDLVKSMSAEGETDPEHSYRRMLRDERIVSGWRAQLATLSLLDRAMLAAIAQGAAPMAAATHLALGKAVRAEVTLAKARACVDRLKRAGLIRKAAASYVLADELMRDYLLEGRSIT